MAEIICQNMKKSYGAVEVISSFNLHVKDREFIVFLGPSGCGKTTLLSIISGLLAPSNGKVIFGNDDVTNVAPEGRNIAQVFQFPVVYDTMTVFDNLAFPLRNRGVDPATVKARVEEVAEMTVLTAMLDRRASGLTADGKQKISLGRGLVRTEVNAILFDEPLTVIDPHLKFQLRSKLKELHSRVNTTMIYVTHDQTEALTFADKVVVMNMGEVVQIGTPKELFERPEHTFVGHFIGSPGMNIIPCEINNGKAHLGPHEIATSNKAEKDALNTVIGVRPEFVQFANKGLNVEIIKVADMGRSKIVDVACYGHSLKLLIGEQEIPSDNAKIAFDPSATRIYSNGHICKLGAA